MPALLLLHPLLQNELNKAKEAIESAYNSVKNVSHAAGFRLLGSAKKGPIPSTGLAQLYHLHHNLPAHPFLPHLLYPQALSSAGDAISK